MAVSSISAVTTGSPDRDQDARALGDVDADQEAVETAIRMARARAASAVADLQRFRRAWDRGGSGGGAVGRNECAAPGHSGGGTGRNGACTGGRPHGPVGTGPIGVTSTGDSDPVASPPRACGIGSGQSTAGSSRSVYGLMARRPG